MAYDRELFIHKLKRWQSYMENFHLPLWEELPDMELYMDQVVSLVNRYLDLIPHDEKNPVLTPSAVNNYVRLKVMPAPEKKRYTRRHLACLIMICALKQSLSLSEIQKIVPADGSDEQIQAMYNDFSGRMSYTTQLFIHQVNSMAKLVLTPGNPSGTDSMVLHSAVSSVLYKLLTVKLTGLAGLSEEEGIKLEN